MSPRQLVGAISAKILPRSWFQLHGPASSQAVALTFDDGPHPVETPRLLDALRDAGVVATFFLVGNQIERHPEIVKRIIDEGHAIGGHSYTHPRPEAIDAAGLVAEVQRTNLLLAEVVGKTAKMFRPPYGGMTIKKLLSLWNIKQSLVFWTVDPKDFACASADEVRANLRQRPLRAGDILLFHDNKPFGADLIPEIAAKVRQQGLRFTTPDDWNRSQS
jgi:peptidoglycan/xylan/chitin deacetylase (PgdA/CDA1 family)